MVKKGEMRKEEARDKVDSIIRKGFSIGHEEYMESNMAQVREKWAIEIQKRYLSKKKVFAEK